MCSAEPKRARTDKTPTSISTHQVNGTTTTTTTATTGYATRSRDKQAKKTMDTSGGGDSAAIPVPQALYVNKNAAAAHLPTGGFVSNGMSLLSSGQGDTTAVAAQPQTLYMNMNGQNGTSGQSLSQSSTSASYGLTQPPPLSHPPLPTSQADKFSSGPHVGMVTSVVASSRPPVNNIANSALVSSAASASRLSNHSTSASTMMSTGTTSFNSAATSQSSSSNSSSSLPEEVTYTSNVLQFPAVQIRIGARKFKPSTLIMVKDDGVLFTLKGM